MAAHRYWRLSFARATSVIRISELALRTSVGGANVATGGTASASHTFGGNSAANAFDGNATTFWNASSGLIAGEPVWLAYDFGAGNDKDIVEYVVTVDSSAGTGIPEGGYLQYSDNGTTWVTVSSGFKMSAFGSVTVPVLGDAAAPKGRKTYGRKFLGWANPEAFRLKGRGQRARIDALDGGRFKIVGTLKVKGTPDTPVARKVLLFEYRSMRVIRETWSNPVTGAYAFNLIKNQQYVVLADDYTATYRAVVADKILPEAMP